ncbi:hypothetical protein AOCH_006200 [Aspergillus ochraceoroseus]|uniref:NADH-ubiquinone reductase complex 1 MLRQ subunit n=1 Tax=Aspergillus ochraceoroseus TaxID=138278 RepID=A0A0F8U2I6_9EURO|nr:hypothetical protein AOCH_006200 [Aspergillus ochraceoroseus]
MYPSRILRMQPSRPYGFPTPVSFLPCPLPGRKKKLGGYFEANRALQKENQSAHTISQRLRTLKRVPPELIPLGVVLAVAVGAAIYSSTRKLMTDKTLRLTPNRPEDREH